jgi:hypothetical protein
MRLMTWRAVSVNPPYLQVSFDADGDVTSCVGSPKFSFDKTQLESSLITGTLNSTVRPGIIHVIWCE